MAAESAVPAECSTRGRHGGRLADDSENDGHMGLFYGRGWKAPRAWYTVDTFNEYLISVPVGDGAQLLLTKLRRMGGNRALEADELDRFLARLPNQ